MKKYSWYSYMTRYLILIILFVNIVLGYQEYPVKLLVNGCMSIVLILNEYLRYNYIYKQRKRLLLSIILSIVLSLLLQISVGRYADFYYIALLYEVIIMLDGRKSRVMLFLHAILFLFLVVFSALGRNMALLKNVLSFDFIRYYGMGMLTSISIYVSFVFIFFFIKFQSKERNEIFRLNEELKKSYERLEKYSKSAEELAVARERNRMAQEMHDNLGHSLSALIMHLDYTEKLMDVDMKRAKELVGKVQEIARSSMAKLRDTVYMLKENDYSNGLIGSLNELIENITSSGNIKVDMRTGDDIEELSPHVKSIIFRTVQESLTNGIKHGKAQEFIIDISCKNGILNISIGDNGRGCENIIPGNGLDGIRRRIKSADGEVRMGNNPEGGFLVEAFIPVKESVV